MNKPVKHKLTKLDKAVLADFNLDPKTYTIKELWLAHLASMEKANRMSLEVFFRSQAQKVLDFLNRTAK